MRDTREHILKTSFILFLRKGFKQVTLNEIVKATKLSKGAFYHYFSSKEQLYLEVIDIYYYKLFAVNYEEFDNNSLYNFYHNYIDILINFSKGITDGFDLINCVDDVNFFALALDSLKNFPNLREKTKELHVEELEAWIKIVKTARENNEIRSILSDEQIAKVFIYTVSFIWIHSILLARKESLETMVLEVANLWDNFYKELSK